MLDLHSIESSLLDKRLKGYPFDADPCAVRDIDARGWNVLRGDLPFPLAVLRESALDHNLRWMADFAAASGVLLAPHGKTTMAPQLFDRQLRAGAWGMTLANMQQVDLCVDLGLRKIIVANQLAGRLDVEHAGRLQERHPDLQLFFLVDSPAQLRLISEVAAQGNFRRPCTVLLELGVPDGRTGCRDMDEALDLARQVAASGHAVLAGVECYEALHLRADSEADRPLVEEQLDRMHRFALQCDAERLFGLPEIILSAGGSAVFDLVARGLPLALSKPVLPILRSGCYVTHDSGFYERFVQLLLARTDPAWRQRGGLHPALEVWVQVQSRPEPGLAILAMGKRDASYDLGMPAPLRWAREGEVKNAGSGWTITRMNDQHAYLALPADAPLQVGDLVACGISHPCTTFDKWRWLPLVNDAYDVTGACRTFF
ncbi:amino acid deaminase [Noviherbaspirillum galbum]|uniref:Amino acid deaminase n=1 Tax=Noviherbaspirillum galbum TaxID=2709383 RepID=A0A6B3SXQ8_9BURK|nr:amino acid deaminase [Noviherbaspirillum galbum]NEX64385.1 amino acid deaminase [Noviherbaspirillum galbum]